MSSKFQLLIAAALPLFVHAADQPTIEVRKAQAIANDSLKFRDLNRNGALDRYEDWQLPADQRVADLISKMSVEEKTGLMIHSSIASFIGPNGEVLGLPAARGRGGPGRDAPPGSSTNRAFQDKPAILTEFIDSVAGAFGVGDAALLDVVFGNARPARKLPFDLPSDMPSAMAPAPDVPFDMDHPLLKFGFGLTYNR